MTVNIFGIKISIGKPILAALIVLVVFSAGIGGFIINRSGGSIIVSKNADQSSVQMDNTGSSAVLKEGTKADADLNKNMVEEIQVYIVGCVKNEGVYTLKKGQIIADAIKAAGGATEEADLSNINMVYKLKDNVMLKIKPKPAVQIPDNTNSGSPKQTTQSEDTGTGAEVEKTDGGAIVSGSQSGKTGGKININTATEEQLDALPGIGAGTAKDIISYREKNGGFKTMNDIMKVPGIKDNKFNKIKDLITAD